MNEFTRKKHTSWDDWKSVFCATKNAVF